MENHIPQFQTSSQKQQESSADKSTQQKTQKKPIFSDVSPNRSISTQRQQIQFTPMNRAITISGYDQQILDLTLQCQSLQIALDTSKKSTDQFIQIIHYKNTEIDRLRRAQNFVDNDQELKHLVQSMEDEIYHLKEASEKHYFDQPNQMNIQNAELLKQLQNQISQQKLLEDNYSLVMAQNDQCVELINQLQFQLQQKESKSQNGSYYKQSQISQITPSREQNESLNQLQNEKSQMIQELDYYKSQLNDQSLKTDEILHKQRKDWVLQKQMFQIQYQQMNEQYIESCVKVIALSSETQRLNQQLIENEEIISLYKQNHSQIQEDDPSITMLQEQVSLLQLENNHLNTLISFNNSEEQLKEVQLQMEYCERLKLEIQELQIKHKVEKDSSEDNIKQLYHKLKVMDQEKISLTKDLKVVEHQLNEKIKELDHYRRLNDQAISKSEYDDLKVTYEKVNNENFEINQELVNTKSRLNSYIKENERLVKQIKMKEEEQLKYVQQMEKGKLDKEANQNDIDQKKKDINHLQHQIQSLQSDQRLQIEQIQLLQKDFEHQKVINQKLKQELENNNQKVE